MRQPYRRAYSDHKYRARHIGIGFELTFDEWLRIWQESGHLEERGPGKYVMARNGDKGPYAVGNVRIIRHAENIDEGWQNKAPEEVALIRARQRSKHPMLSPEIRARVSVAVKAARARKSWGNSPETRAKISAGNKAAWARTPNRPEAVAKAVAKNTGQKRSAETKARISAAMRALKPLT